MKKPKTWLYRWFRPLLIAYIFILYKPTIINAHAIPKSGPVITAGNHSRLVLDSLMICVSTPRILRFLAKKEHFQGPKKLFFANVGCVPVDRGKGDDEAKKVMIELLKTGNIINIFPEGTRNREGKELLLPFKKGVAVFANKTDATIVPFAITSSWRPFKYDTIVEFGEGFKGSGDIDADTEKLKKSVAKILKKNKR